MFTIRPQPLAFMSGRKPFVVRYVRVDRHDLSLRTVVDAMEAADSLVA